MQNQCNLNVRSKCILNALRIRKGTVGDSRKLAFFKTEILQNFCYQVQ